jgi:hypothetical protein
MLIALFPNKEINMKNKIRTALSFIGAPCLGIDFYRHAYSVDQWDISVSTRICDILYMAGWICAMFTFIHIQVNGEKKSARNILYIQLLFLFLAGSSDVAAFLKIPVPESLFFYWDLFWPISNCMMLVTGISIAAAGKLRGWQRWIPLLAGLWLPVTILVKIFLSLEYMAYIGGTYSIIMWTIMAYVAHSNREQDTGNETERLHKGFRPRVA